MGRLRAKVDLILALVAAGVDQADRRRAASRHHQDVAALLPVNARQAQLGALPLRWFAKKSGGQIHRRISSTMAAGFDRSGPESRSRKGRRGRLPRAAR